MKKLIVSALIALVLSSCASLGEAKLLKPVTTWGFLTVEANPRIYYVGESAPDGGLLDLALTGATNNGVKDGTVNALLERTDVLVSQAEELLLATAGEIGPKLITKEAVLAAPSYVAFKETMGIDLVTMRPPGYKSMPIGESDVRVGIAKDLGADATVNATFLFQKRINMGMMGTGTLGAQTSLSISVFNKAGKTIFQKYYVGTSLGDTGVVANIYDPSKFEPLAMESARAAIKLFAADLAAR